MVLYSTMGRTYVINARLNMSQLRGDTSKENTNSSSRSQYNAINMIIKRQIMTQSDTEITVRVSAGLMQFRAPSPTGGR
jgi:hypothetical protein